MDNSQTDQGISDSLSRKLRLKQLLDHGQQLERDISGQDSKLTLTIIQSLIKASDDIINEGDPKDRVEHTTEVVLDTHVLKMNHELVDKVIQQSLEFSEHIYLNAINAIVDKGTTVSWNAFTDMVFNVAKTANVQSTMLGAIEVELKQNVAKEKQKRQRVVLGAEKRPETVSQLKRQDKGADKMNVLHKQLGEIFKANQCHTIPFYKLIVDPKNFMNSVENAFQMAFLARDGIIGIDVGEDGNPTVRLVQSAEQKIQMDTSQWICSLDEEKCDKMAKLYKITEPLLKIELDEVEEDDAQYEEEEYLDSDE